MTNSHRFLDRSVSINNDDSLIHVQHVFITVHYPSWNVGIMDLPLHRTRPDSQTEFEVSCNRPPLDRNEGRASKRDLRIVCESVQLLPNCWVRYIQLEHYFLDRLLNGNHTSQHFDLQTSISGFPWFFTLHFHLYMI